MGLLEKDISGWGSWKRILGGSWNRTLGGSRYRTLGGGALGTGY